MKLNSQLFQGRQWLLLLIIGALVSLLLTVYFSYLLWQNTQTDSDNIQQIREFQAASSNALFFAEKAVTGDPAAIEPLNSTVALMDETVTQLQQADDFTKSMLPQNYEKLEGLWISVQENAKQISDNQDAFELLIATRDRVANASIAEESLIVNSIERLAAAGAPQAQVNSVGRQSILLRQMQDSLSKFIAEDAPNRRQFDEFRTSLDRFNSSYNQLVRGNSAAGVPAVSDTQVRANLEKVNQSIGSIRANDSTILGAVERVIASRGAEQRIVSSFEALQFELDGMANTIETFPKERFPRVVHIIIALVALALFIIGLIMFQRVSAQREVEEGYDESQKTQGAILRLLDELVDLADGDLTISATVSEDFTGAIADSINFTIDQLRQLVSRINSTAVQVSHAAQGTQQTALHLAEASDHQAQEIAGASAAINEMAVTIDQVSANASESALVAGKSVSIANNGVKLVQNTIHGMDTIREQIQDTSKRIKRLGESSQEIGDIVSLINDIADQTNILALNAAIQASMAGDAGRGFAVVADEVQRLAERSAAATKQIETLVRTIQTDTNEAVISMEQTTAEVVNGARLAQDAGVALEEIESVSANLAELIQNISNAARQQASSAGHISNTMNVIQEITSQTSAGTGATAQSIGDLAKMALDLRESVAGFTLPADMIADLEEQEMAAVDAPAAPPLLETVDEPAAGDLIEDNVGNMLSELEQLEGEAESADDFFELLSTDDDNDLLSEFDVDLSDAESQRRGKPAQ